MEKTGGIDTAHTHRTYVRVQSIAPRFFFLQRNSLGNPESIQIRGPQQNRSMGL